MNKQELIKEFEEIGIYSLNLFSTVVEGIPTKTAIKLIKQLDEPEKVKVPQFVADWITHSKNIGRSLFGAMSIFEENFEIKKWMQWAENQETFALAWIFGYEVEKEKRYIVRIKGVVEDSAYLKHQLQNNHWYYGSLTECSLFSPYHTKKELEEAGFGWVFDCPGIEIEEVEECLKA